GNATGPPPGWRPWTRSTGWPARTCGTPRGPRRCAAWATPGRHATRCGRRWSWHPPPPERRLLARRLAEVPPPRGSAGGVRRRRVLSDGASSSLMRNRKTGIQEDEMTATLTASLPAAAGAAEPQQAGAARRPRVTLIVGSLAGF